MHRNNQYSTLAKEARAEGKGGKVGRIFEGGKGTYDSEIPTDSARLGSEGVGGTEELAAGLDDFFALPDHGADGAGCHVYISRHISIALRVVGWGLV